ncbi:hypothetical protein ACFL6S_07850 [Candidatus Poribacteria bacterium]
MQLSQKDVRLFYKLHPHLLFYGNQQLEVIKNVPSVDTFVDLPVEDRINARDALYERLDIIDAFVDSNPFRFSDEELEIILSWKNMVRGTFQLFRYLKKYAVFLDDKSPMKAYGVVALIDSFEDILGSALPIMLQGVLLPFRGQIIYDGFLQPYRIYFGGGIRRSLNAEYQEAKSRYGIITSLPFTAEDERSDEDMLRFYLKNQRNREQYQGQIEVLIHRDSSFLTLYHQEMGKMHARTLGKQLREVGLQDAWFAILEGLIVAGGKTREEVECIVHEIVPVEKESFAYIFHLS